MGDIGTSSVDVDTPCRRCGYSLFGQQTDGRCPECGGSVAASNGIGVLARCDPRWTAGRAVAMATAFWGTLMYAAVNVANAAVPTSPAATVAAIVWRGRASFVLESAVVFVIAAAHWRVSAPAPAGDRTGWDRLAYRAGIVALAVARVVQTALVFGVPAHGSLLMAFRMANWVAVVGLIVAGVGYFGYACQLARRVPSDTVARVAKASGWVAAVLLLAYAGLAAWVAFSRPGDKFPRGFYLLYGLTAVGLLACGASKLGLLWWLRRRFQRAAVAASAGA